MNQEHTRGPVEEFRGRLAQKCSSAEMAEWIKSLPEEDRQLLAADYRRIIADMAETWQHIADLFVDSAERVVEAASQAAAIIEQWGHEVTHLSSELEEGKS